MNKLLLTVLGGCLISSQVLAAGKKYIVTVNSPQIYKQIQAQANGFNTFGSFSNQQSQFHFFSQNPQAISDTLNNLEMLVVETDDEQAIAALKTSKLVSVEEDVIFPAPKPVAKFDIAKHSISSGGPVPVPWGIKAVKAPGAWSASNEGDGIRVMVLDTGIDKDHPALKQRFEAGRNFMSRNDKPAYDFFDDNGHGTHVAGTIAADGVNGNLVGVAPKAKILAGRVCGGSGCSTAAILGGVDWGISEGVDVISMSLGGPFPSSAALKAYQRAEAANIVVVAASGNDGTKKVSYPAAYPTVYAVGAIDEKLEKAGFSQWGKELNIVAPGVDVFSSMPLGMGRSSSAKSTVDKSVSDLKSAPMAGSGIGEIEAGVVFAGLGKPEDYKDVKAAKSIALIQRGEISFKDKADNAVKNGAIAVVVYNNEDGVLNGTLGDVTNFAVPVIGMDKAQGDALKAAVLKGAKVTLTVVVEKTDHASMQGTSMATPHVSGVVALVRAANPELSPVQVRDLISSTAVKLSGPNNENQWGAGLINAEAAVSRASIMPAVAGL